MRSTLKEFISSNGNRGVKWKINDRLFDTNEFIGEDLLRQWVSTWTVRQWDGIIEVETEEPEVVSANVKEEPSVIDSPLLNRNSNTYYEVDHTTIDKMVKSSTTYYGSEIKDAVNNRIAYEEELFGRKLVNQIYTDFRDRYIICEHPLANSTRYNVSLRKFNGKDTIICYKDETY